MLLLGPGDLARVVHRGRAWREGRRRRVHRGAVRRHAVLREPVGVDARLRLRLRVRRGWNGGLTLHDRDLPRHEAVLAPLLVVVLHHDELHERPAPELHVLAVRHKVVAVHEEVARELVGVQEAPGALERPHEALQPPAQPVSGPQERARGDLLRDHPAAVVYGHIELQRLPPAELRLPVLAGVVGHQQVVAVHEEVARELVGVQEAPGALERPHEALQPPAQPVSGPQERARGDLLRDHPAAVVYGHIELQRLPPAELRLPVLASVVGHQQVVAVHEEIAVEGGGVEETPAVGEAAHVAAVALAQALGGFPAHHRLHHGGLRPAALI
mmetsp:Transcript_103098/g.292024  ORF Transcript_103098/g.292024 Transcript_103098/m.292024 type:complete len:328 (+) Transcript_103098:1492-2475(+)